MNFNSIEDIFSAFNNQKVLIVGDVMVDYYVYGKVERISPEAPVPVVNVYKREQRLGGAANVALNIQSLGATPILCSVIGDDIDGKCFTDILDNINIPSKGIVSSKYRITTKKKRVLAGSQQMLRIDSETEENLNNEERKDFLDRVHQLLPEVDVVIFEDYDKGVLSEDIIQDIISLANSKGIPTVVDPKKKNFFSYKNATLFKPNLKELKEGLKLDIEPGNLEQLQLAVNTLKEKLQLKSAMITLSERGIYIDSSNGKYHLPAHFRSIADVSGAGDTVISIAALCTALKLDSKFIAALSNLGGGLVCEHLGVVPVNKERLLQEAKINKLF